MFLFRSVFIVAFASLAFVAHGEHYPRAPPREMCLTSFTVSAIILPLTRYMLDAVPEGTEKNTDVDPNATTVPADVSTSASDANVPVAADTTPAVEEDDNTSTANVDSADVANLATSDASNVETSDSSSTEPSTSNTTSVSSRQLSLRANLISCRHRPLV